MDFMAIIFDLAETATLDYCYHKAEMHKAEVQAALGKVKANIKRNQLVIANADDRLKNLKDQDYARLEYEADKIEAESEYSLLKNQEFALIEFLSLLKRFMEHIDKEVFNTQPRLCMSVVSSILVNHIVVQENGDENECKELVWKMFSQDLKSAHKSKLLKLCNKS